MVKDSTNEVLKDLYKEKGLKDTIITAYQMLKINNHKSDKLFRAHLHGEICETVLELIIVDFMNRNKEQTKDWILSKGLILPNIDNIGSTYRTEIDLTIFTPYKILTFECKSYAGDKTITGMCTVERKGMKSVNVYSQHSKHAMMLLKLFNPCRYVREGSDKVSPMQLAYFDFALGTIKDEREAIDKDRMPILRIDSIGKLLAVYTKRPVYYDMKDVKKIVDKLEFYKEKQTKKHLDYVTHIKH